MDNQPKATTDSNLRVSFYSDGVGYSEAILLYGALGDYSENLIQQIAWAHKGEDDESAASFWEDFQRVTEMQRRLFDQVSRVAFQNYEASRGKQTDKEANTRNAIQDYRKIFDVK